MPRPPRVIRPGVPVHIVQRGNNRVATFHSTTDFARYLEHLGDASRQFDCAIHAYVLMSNHVHLLLTPEDQSGPSLMMQTIGRWYVRYLNARVARTGTLWEGRFRSSQVDSDHYFLACSRYIELNPVRAQMVEQAPHYRWSSYRCNAQGIRDELITPHLIYQKLAPDAADRLDAYRALFANPLDQQTIDRIRYAVKRGLVLGSDEGVR
jgi:putative transposase